MKHPILYDRHMNRVTELAHAFDIGYRHVKNDLWTGSFSLPDADPANALCQEVYALVELFDGDVSAGLYRIAGEPETDAGSPGAAHTYTLEHVLAFLLDDRIHGVLELGGTGISTRMVLEKLLSFQSEKRWVLGDCDFTYYFQYGWESEDLLSAIFAVPRCFEEEVHWEYDTSVYPFRISLKRAEEVPSCSLRRGRNITGVRRGRDLSNLCTRLYCLGSGEGTSQTGIRDAEGNVSGLPYIESANVSRYGVIARHFIDSSCTDPDLLYARGKALLRTLEEPEVTYRIAALDLFRKTGVQEDRLEEGRCVRVYEPVLGIDFTTRIEAFEKKNVTGDPLSAVVELTGRATDVAGEMEVLSRRAAITAHYAQGATNLFPLQIMDNADERHPARLRFFVPASCSHINTVLLSYTLSPFRAFSTGAAAGGATVTTTSGGGNSTETSSTGGETTVTSAGGGGGTTTTEAASKYNNFSGTTGYSDQYTGNEHVSGSHHTHYMSHTHQYADSITVEIPALTVKLPSHRHQVSLPGHTHSVTIPGHTHTVTLQDHQHAMVYGIYEGGRADKVTVAVDGNPVPEEAMVDGQGNLRGEIDVVPYLAMSNGRITRNTWHEITLTPDRLTRIEANLFVQTFITSWTGGNY